MLHVAKLRKEELLREKAEKVKQREERKRQQILDDEAKLLDCKRILGTYQHDRSLCNKKLTCGQFVLLLNSMGLHKEAMGRNGKRLLKSDLLTL